MTMGYSHRIIRQVARWAIFSFFHEIRVVGTENVPEEGPVIVCCTHHNMMIDPGVLSSTFPHHRPLHYWAKATLFKNPLANFILLDSGNIPVDRGNKDNQVLFKGTFEALAAGDVVALFPEGTSYTEYKIMQVKDGAAWSALEYTKWARDHPEAQDVVVIPAGITYVNKTKYRSSVVIEYGAPIKMAKYMEIFDLPEEGAKRRAAKTLTFEVERQLFELTINAPDWDSLFAAKMARELLWEDEKTINLDDFVAVSQTLVDLFSTEHLSTNFATLKPLLLKYYALLTTTHLTNSVLSSLALPRSLDPSRPAPMPTRLTTLLYLARDTIASLIRLPFFFIPLLLHIPAYIFSRIGGRMVEHEEETQAQNKVVFGLLFMSIVYGTMFWGLFFLLALSPVGALVAAGTVYLFAVYHTRLIDDNYEHAKRLVAAWRVLLGVWAPSRWDLDLSTVNYRAPERDPNNLFIKPKSSAAALRDTSPAPSLPSTPAPPTPAPPTIAPTSSPAGQRPKREKAAVPKKAKRPPSRRLIRHVLRTRAQAINALAEFLMRLEWEQTEVRASTHLGKLYGRLMREDELPGRQQPQIEVRAKSLAPPTPDRGMSVPPPESYVRAKSLAPPSTLPELGQTEVVGTDVDEMMRGYRNSKEVVAFLRARGAKIRTGVRSTAGSGEEGGEWGALSSGEEDGGMSSPGVRSADEDPFERFE